MDIAYCTATTLISPNVYLMFSLGNLNVMSIFSIERMCVVALTLAVMTISGSTFHHLLIILSICGLYLYIYSFIW